jgi:hypothetical protein
LAKLIRAAFPRRRRPQGNGGVMADTGGDGSSQFRTCHPETPAFLRAPGRHGSYGSWGGALRIFLPPLPCAQCVCLLFPFSGKKKGTATTAIATERRPFSTPYLWQIASGASASICHTQHGGAGFPTTAETDARPVFASSTIRSARAVSDAVEARSKSRSSSLGGLDLLDPGGEPKIGLGPSAPQLRTGGHATSNDRTESR